MASLLFASDPFLILISCERSLCFFSCFSIAMLYYILYQSEGKNGLRHSWVHESTRGRSQAMRCSSRRHLLACVKRDRWTQQSQASSGATASLRQTQHRHQHQTNGPNNRKQAVVPLLAFVKHTRDTKHSTKAQDFRSICCHGALKSMLVL